MTDIPSWLKGFQRARAPAATTPFEHPNFLDEINEVPGAMQSAQITSRLSSYQNLGRLSTISVVASESQHPLNQVEQIWHNPDPDQMAETLKVAMMTQNSFDPLHVRFNSCILHVLEAYHHTQGALLDKDREIRDRERSHENDIQEFRQQQIRWMEKEEQYKSDMKKLEVMLATGKRGLELVTLARSESARNVTPPSEAIKAQGLKKETEVWQLTPDEAPMMSDFAERKDSSMSASYTSQRHTKHVDRSPTARQSHQAEGPFSFESSKRNARYGNEDDEDSNTVHPEQLYSVAYSETTTDSLSIDGGDLELRARRHSSPFKRSGRYRICVEPLTYASKQLLNPNGLKEPSIEDSAWEDEQLESSERQDLTGSAIHQRGFSFVPGDDYARLPLGRARRRATVQALEKYEDGRKSEATCLSSHVDLIGASLAEKQCRPRHMLGVEEKKRASKQVKPAKGQKAQPMRNDSQTSIITAVLVRSAGSSQRPELLPAALKVPQPNYPTGSSEATIAAVRAIAAESGKHDPNSSQM